MLKNIQSKLDLIYLNNDEHTHMDPRGAHVKILIGMLVLSVLGFEIWPNPIFLGWQIFELFFWVSQNYRYFLGSDKFPAIFLGLPIFVSHTWMLWTKNTQYWKTKS